MTSEQRYVYNIKWRNENRDRVNELSRNHTQRNRDRAKYNNLIVARLKFGYPEIYKELSLKKAC